MKCIVRKLIKRGAQKKSQHPEAVESPVEALPETEPQPQPYSLEWYRQRAERGDANAQYELGKRYEYDDPEEAERWYLKAAKQNHVEAMHCLSVFYADGDRYNEKESAKWLAKAAKLGDSAALSELSIYSTGKVLPADKELEELYIREAQEDNPHAIYKLGCNYLYGMGGVLQNLDKAVACLIEAADLEHEDAMYEVARCYENGWGLHKDENEAIYWYRVAVSYGNDMAKDRLKELQDEEDF